MNAITPIDMQEATRLTREGRLQEAMALLRGGVATQAPSAPKAAAWAQKLAGLKRGPASSAAIVPVPEGARFEDRSFAGDSGGRTYKVYIPSGCTGQAVPMVVMLHGCTQSPDDFALGTKMNALAEAQTFIVVYPAQTQAANVSKCWNWFNARDQQRDGGEAAIIAGLTRAAAQDFNVDTRRIYVAGLSAGGAAAAIMGMTYPDLYAAVGVHSGLACGAATDLPSALSAMRQGAAGGRGGAGSGVPTIVFHGDSDGTVNQINGEQVIAQAGAPSPRTRVIHGEEAGVSYKRTVDTDESGATIREHWLLRGAGHAWSGGDPRGSYAVAAGPDASREMVRFFLQHERPR